MTTTTPADGIHLGRIPVHVAASGTAVTIEGFTFDPPGFEAYMAAHTTPDDPGRLVFVEQSAAPWTTWERHAAGDEVVVVIAGAAVFIQEIEGEEVRTRASVGEAVINPAGVWHTADLDEPFTAVYLTPCPGTEHRART